MPTALSCFGTDRGEEGPDGARTLLCVFPKPWLPRKPGSLTSAEYPGTAVRWDGELFEVVAAVASPDGSMRYSLEPWSGRHAIRAIQSYDAAAERAGRVEQSDRHAAIWKRRFSILLSPLLGHLPGPVQEQMEGDFGAPARWMTAACALPLFILGGVGLLSARAASMGGGAVFAPWLVRHPGVALYLLLESGFRLAVVFLLGNPMGSLPGVIGYEIWRRATGARPAQRSSSEPPLASRWNESDIYKMLEPLLALLSPAEQELLRRRFGFDPIRWGRRGAILIAIVALLNLILSLGALAQSRDTVWDAFWLVAGIYLFFEQIVRFRRLAAGRPAGSALGTIVRRLARKLLVQR